MSQEFSTRPHEYDNITSTTAGTAAQAGSKIEAQPTSISPVGNPGDSANLNPSNENGQENSNHEGGNVSENHSESDDDDSDGE